MTIVKKVLLIISVITFFVIGFIVNEPLKEKPVQAPKMGFMNGKVVPLTPLSEEDSKRPCKDCHKEKY